MQRLVDCRPHLQRARTAPHLPASPTPVRPHPPDPHPPERRVNSMAIPLGTENKRQVYLVVALFVLIVAIGGYELYGTLGGSSTLPLRSAAVPSAVAGQTATSNSRPSANLVSASDSQSGQGGEAEKLTNAGLDPTVYFEKL